MSSICFCKTRFRLLSKKRNRRRKWDLGAADRFVLFSVKRADDQERRGERIKSHRQLEEVPFRELGAEGRRKNLFFFARISRETSCLVDLNRGGCSQKKRQRSAEENSEMTNFAPQIIWERQIGNRKGRL